MRDWWIRTLWRLMPSDYRRHAKMRLLRAWGYWRHEDSATAAEISQMLATFP